MDGLQSSKESAVTSNGMAVDEWENLFANGNGILLDSTSSWTLEADPSSHTQPLPDFNELFDWLDSTDWNDQESSCQVPWGEQEDSSRRCDGNGSLTSHTPDFPEAGRTVKEEKFGGEAGSPSTHTSNNRETGKRKMLSPKRTSRDRAAHNEYEKKRRQRIRKLQKVVPNASENDDKASLLDKAIEYIKQMQAIQPMIMQHPPPLLINHPMTATPNYPLTSKPASAPVGNMLMGMGNFPFKNIPLPMAPMQMYMYAAGFPAAAHLSYMRFARDRVASHFADTSTGDWMAPPGQNVGYMPCPFGH